MSTMDTSPDSTTPSTTAPPSSTISSNTSGLRFKKNSKSAHSNPPNNTATPASATAADPSNTTGSAAPATSNSSAASAIPNSSPSGIYPNFRLSRERAGLDAPVSGFSRLFHTSRHSYYLRTEADTIIEVPLMLMRNVLDYALELSRTRGRSSWQIRIAEPAGYRVIAHALNADPAQHFKLPYITQDNTIVYASTGRFSYPLDPQFPDIEKIRKVTDVVDLFGDDFTASELFDIMKQALRERPSHGKRTRSYSSNNRTLNKKRRADFPQ